MKYGILFDLDGTLWDSSNTVAPAWNEVMASEGLTVTPAIMRSMMGKTLMEIGKALLPALSPERHKALTDECSRLECIRLRENGAYLFPDVKETLERLKKQYYLGLVSNCQIPYKEAFLHYYHFESLFDGTLCAGETGRGKGENIATLVKKAELEKAVYVGDTQSDFDAAQDAGTAFVWAGYGFGQIDRETDKIAHFSELPDLVRKMLEEKEC